MIAGHYTTALVANQRSSRGHIAYFLAASQGPDLVWLCLAAVGVPSFHTHAGPISPAMMIGHDLVPLVGWIVLAGIVGKLVFGDTRTALFGSALVVIHELCDVVSGFPHNLFGPDTWEFGPGLYLTAPHLAVGIEALFAAAVMAWVVVQDRAAGVQRARSTYAVWALVFGGGIGTSLLTADGLATFDPNAPLPLVVALGLLGTYLFQMALLTWAEQRPLADGPATAR